MGEREGFDGKEERKKRAAVFMRRLARQNFQRRAQHYGMTFDDEEVKCIGEDAMARLDLEPDKSTYMHAGPLFVEGRQIPLTRASEFDPAAYEIRPPYVCVCVHSLFYVNCVLACFFPDSDCIYYFDCSVVGRLPT